MTRTGTVSATVGPAAAACTAGTILLAVEPGHDGSAAATIAIMLPALLAFVFAGATALVRRPGNRTGALMLAVGFTGFLGVLSETGSALLFTLGELLGSLFMGVFAHLLVAYPSGRIDSRRARAVIAGGYALSVVGPALVLVFHAKPAVGCTNCPHNLLLVEDNAAARAAARAVVALLSAVALGWVSRLMWRRRQAASPAARRILGPILVMGSVDALLLLVAIVSDAVDEGGSLVISALAYVGFFSIPFLFLTGLLRSRLARSTAAQLALAVPEQAPPEQTQIALRRALHDATLELAFWRDDSRSYVDVEGRPVDPLPAGPGRTATFVAYGDRPVAALIHDAALDQEPELLDEVVALARIGLEKDRLQVELQARIEELRREQEFTRTVLETTPSLLVLLDPHGRIVRFNRTTQALTQVPDDERVRGRHFWEVFVVPEQRDEAERAFRARLPGEHESAWVSAGGARRTVSWSCTDIVGSGGEPFLLLSGTDLTERVHQYEFVDTVLETAPALVIVFDADGRIVRFNRACEEVSGWSSEEVVGRRFYDFLIPPDEIEDVRLALAEVNATGRPGRHENHWVTRSGERRLISWANNVLFDSAGRVAHHVSAGLDVTERHRQQAELLHQHAFTETVLETVPTLVLVVDREGRVVRFNRACEELSGYSSDEVVGKLFYDVLVPRDEVAAIRAFMAERASERVPALHENHWLTRSGERRLTAWAGTVLLDADGEIEYHIGAGVDVTEQRHAESELARLRAALEANVGELRASRQRIVQAEERERRRLERNLHDGAQQRLVSLSLALRLAQSRLASDPPEAERLLESARNELAQALEELRELARGIHPAVLTDRGLAAALDALASRCPLPVELEAPSERLPQPVEAAAYYVVAEALTNVVRYAGATQVRVTVERRDGSAVVEVSDDGAGGADPAKGSGLRGLADRVEALDGRLEVASPPGAGTRVRAELPCGPPGGA